MSAERQFDHQVVVSGQIEPADVARLAQAGIGMIINNRPDNEDIGQPQSSEIEEAAGQAGIRYRHIPISRGIGPSDIEEMRRALEDASDQAVLAFCRSGNRSSLVSALARRREGKSRDEVVECLRNVGASPDPIAHLL